NGLLPLVWRARHTIAGPALVRLFRSWSTIHSNQMCLLVIVLSIWGLVLIAWGTLYWLESSVQSTAAHVARALREQIHSQAHQLGAGDLFLGQRRLASDLFAEKTDGVQMALSAWWRVVPHVLFFAILMLGLAFSVDVWLSLSTILLTALCWR